MKGVQTTAQNVHFEGPWLSGQRQLVSNAIEEFETGRHNDGFYKEKPSWICVAYDLNHSTLFCAHRPHLPDVLAALSVEGLARDIRDAAQ